MFLGDEEIDKVSLYPGKVDISVLTSELLQKHKEKLKNSEMAVSFCFEGVPSSMNFFEPLIPETLQQQIQKQ